MPDLVLVASLAGGLFLLAFAGDLLVAGAVSLAGRIGVSPLVAGIFIVGFGTSAPEMIVAVDAALEGYPGLAFGNIVGSNIANIWLVLGLPALLAPLATGGFGQKRTLAFMLGATAAWIGITAVSPLHAGVGVLFLGALIGYGIYTWMSTAQAQAKGIDVGVSEKVETMKLWRSLAYIGIGLVGLPLGASLIVDGGVGLARIFGVPEHMIGLTLIAVGTSLPEIGAAIGAVRHNKTSVIIGNALGSNLFNILGAGGLIAFFSNQDGEPAGVTESFYAYDHWALALAALTPVLFIFRKVEITRLAGVAMLLVYALYIYGLVQGWDLRGLFTGGQNG